MTASPEEFKLEYNQRFWRGFYCLLELKYKLSLVHTKDASENGSDKEKCFYKCANGFKFVFALLPRAFYCRYG